jgi:hypothetical protein
MPRRKPRKRQPAEVPDLAAGDSTSIYFCVRPYWDSLEGAGSAGIAPLRPAWPRYTPLPTAKDEES